MTEIKIIPKQNSVCIDCDDDLQDPIFCKMLGIDDEAIMNHATIKMSLGEFMGCLKRTLLGVVEEAVNKSL